MAWRRSPGGAEWGPWPDVRFMQSPMRRIPTTAARTSTAGARFRLVGVAVGVVLLVWFAVANTRKVQIDFWVFNRQAPLILVIVISGLLGALITALIMRRKPKPKAEE